MFIKSSRLANILPPDGHCTVLLVVGWSLSLIARRTCGTAR
jgi:hypothetical protein